MRKVYVKVISQTDEDGKITPIRIIWENGRTYDIDKVTDIRRSYVPYTGGTAIRYTVKVMGKETFIFLENSKWFVQSIV